MSMWGNYPLTEEYRDKVKADFIKGDEAAKKLLEAVSKIAIATGAAEESVMNAVNCIKAIYDKKPNH